VQTARRVSQHELRLACAGALDGVEDDGARIAALSASDDLGAAPLGPHAQLVGCRSTEGVARRQEDTAARRRLGGGQLADRGGLAHAVYPDEEPDRHAAG
jgi:hypothetical protein